MHHAKSAERLAFAQFNNPAYNKVLLPKVEENGKK